MNIAYILAEHGRISCTELDLYVLYGIGAFLGFISGYIVRDLKGSSNGQKGKTVP